MKIDVIEKYKGVYDKVYLQTNTKDNRKRVSMFGDGGSKWISYAKYLWEAHFGDIPQGYEVDHINNDKTDDRIENLQLLPKSDNIKKSHKKETQITLVCPICGKSFLFLKRNLSTHPNPCCSKQCGYKKGALTRKRVM